MQHRSAEAVALFFLARADVRRNTRAREAIDRFTKSIIIFTRGTAVRKPQEIVARDVYARTDGLVPVQRG